MLLRIFDHFFRPTKEVSIDNWPKLPDEIIREIFLRLEIPEILTCKAVCRRFRKMASDRLLWQQLFIRTFGFVPDAKNVEKVFASENMLSPMNCELLFQEHFTTEIASNHWIHKNYLVFIDEGKANAWNLLTGDGESEFPLFRKRHCFTVLEHSLIAVYSSRSPKFLFRTLQNLNNPFNLASFQFYHHHVLAWNSYSLSIWNLNTWFQVMEFHHLSQPITCVNTQNLPWIFIGFSSGDIAVCNCATGQKRYVLKGHANAITFLHCFQNVVISASKDKTMKVWKDEELIAETSVPQCITSITICQPWIISGGCKGTIHVWNFDTNQLSYFEHGSRVSALHHYQHVLISGSEEGPFKVWDLNTKKECHILKKREGPFECEMYRYYLFAVCGRPNQAVLKIWNVLTGRCLVTKEVKDPTSAYYKLKIFEKQTFSIAFESGIVKVFRFPACLF